MLFVVIDSSLSHLTLTREGGLITHRSYLEGLLVRQICEILLSCEAYLHVAYLTLLNRCGGHHTDVKWIRRIIMGQNESTFNVVIFSNISNMN